MKSRFYALVFALGLASFEVSAITNLVINGDFETGDSLGWTTSGSNLEWISSPYQGTARQGNYAWQYDAYPNNPAFINQTLNTIAGTKYTLSFDTMVYGGSPNNFSISVGGSLLYSFNNSPDYSWKTDVVYFTATSDDEVLSVGGASEPLWVEVDNVSVTAVPEPSAFSLLAIGLGALALRRRRRSPLALKIRSNGLFWGMKNILGFVILAVLSSFASTSNAATIISYTDRIDYPQSYPNGLEQLYFDGSALSVAPFSANNSTSHGWNIYNSEPMMGQSGGLYLWNWGNTFQWVQSGPLAKDTSINSTTTLGGINHYFPTYSSSLSNNYWGLAYSAGGGNYNYGWVQLSYDASTKTATFVGAAINTTPNQEILVGQVPEPSALSLLAIGLGGLALVRRRSDSR